MWNVPYPIFPASTQNIVDKTNEEIGKSSKFKKMIIYVFNYVSLN